MPDPGSCRAAISLAIVNHTYYGPHFPNRGQCENRYGSGNCGTAEDVLRSGFPDAARAATLGAAASGPNPVAIHLPLLVGYMMSRPLGGGPWKAEALYRDEANNAYTGGGGGSGGGGYTERRVGNLGDRMAFRDIAPNTASRGGFGHTANLHSASS